jgi:23S rRNA (cytidine1920-2'-O)/16S rRNA (cytidine1409-2'-O)-methyltransferase
MRKRLDHILVERGLAPTRSRARDVISRGLVSVDRVPVGKPGRLVDPNAVLVVAPDAGIEYASRGALKLKAAIDAFGFDASGRVALDIGASTGGFTDVLLELGAVRVYAVDVGSAQLHPRLKEDRRVVSLEHCDARNVSGVLVPEPLSAIVADVSFISLRKALPAALSLAERGAWLAALIKPQFEAGPGDIGKGGIVRDENVRECAVRDVSAWMSEQKGWRVADVVPSPIAGGSGNREFLLGAHFDG